MFQPSLMYNLKYDKKLMKSSSNFEGSSKIWQLSGELIIIQHHINEITSELITCKTVKDNNVIHNMFH